MERQDMSTLWYTKPAAEWEEALPLGCAGKSAETARTGPAGTDFGGRASDPSGVHLGTGWTERLSDTWRYRDEIFK